ncbi:hypothetical protein CEXT_305531 [Caerostris extrusa]|uniref:Ribosomal protein L20 n=1 Tax=Caerostris extrusa TaxID=172846 RepID=A0AAV4WXX3_CAEEX|nr:hypothetical protein CEXT_305531 [Caerostris extrusa]
MGGITPTYTIMRQWMTPPSPLRLHGCTPSSTRGDATTPTGRQEDDRHRKNRLFKLRDTCLHRSPKSAGRFRALRRVGAWPVQLRPTVAGMHTLGSMGEAKRRKTNLRIIHRKLTQLFSKRHLLFAKKTNMYRARFSPITKFTLDDALPGSIKVDCAIGHDVFQKTEFFNIL